MTLSLGSVIYTAVKPIFKIYFIIGTGFLLSKLNVLTVETTRNISDMLVMVILPCMTFNKIVGSISIKDLKAIGVICLTAAILYTLGAVLAVITTYTTPGIPKKWRGGVMAVGVFPNIADLPIAYIQTLDTGSVFSESDGEKGIAFVCIFLATFMFVLFNCGGFRLVEIDFDEPNQDLEVGYDKEESSLEVPPQIMNYPIKEEAEGVVVSNQENVANMADEFSAVTSLSSSNAESPTDDDGYIQRIATDNTGVKKVRTGPTADNRSRRRSSVQQQQAPQVYSITSGISRITTGNTMLTNNSLRQVGSRTLELRTLPSQNVRNVINEYSRANNDNVLNKMNTITKIVTTGLGATSTKDLKQAGDSIPFVKKYHLQWLVFTFQNFMRPASLALMISILVALVPWLKALFVHTDLVPHMKNAPDNLPPLSFLLDYTSYVGQAAVPLGLIMLGTTMSRLSFKKIDKKLLTSITVLLFLKHVVSPIVGILWATKLKNLHWLDNKMIFFVIVLSFSLPSATALFYITASCTDPKSENQVQMECLSVWLLAEYMILFVSLPFVVTYMIKVTFKQ